MNRLSRTRSAIAFVFALAVVSFAGTATLETFTSAALGRSMTYWVYLPANYEAKKAAGEKFAVVYLLHWYQYRALGWHDCSFDGCARQNPDMDNTIDSVSNVIGIAPQDEQAGAGGRIGTSWWIDNVGRPTAKYGTFLTQDLRTEVNAKYATYTDAPHTGIVGCSMGGFGTLHQLRTNKSIYGTGYAVVALTDLSVINRPPAGTSTGCDWDLCSVFGTDYWTNQSILTQYSPMANVEGFRGIKFGISTAQTDFFGGESRAFDAALTTAGITHDFKEYAGGHEYPNALQMKGILRFMFGTAIATKQPVVSSVVKTTSANKARVAVSVGKGSVATTGSYVGIDGRSLTAVPATGVVLIAR